MRRTTAGGVRATKYPSLPRCEYFTLPEVVSRGVLVLHLAIPGNGVMSEVFEATSAAPVVVDKPLDLAYEGAVVRYLEADGRVSTELCEVKETGLRNNRVVVTPHGTNRRIQVNKRRLLPPTADRAATVVEDGDRYKALCPRCGKSIAFLSGATEADCLEHGKFPLHWLGVKPMSVDESNTGTKPPRAPKEDKVAKPPRERPRVVPKEPKAPKEPASKKTQATRELQTVDLDAIARRGELYTKGGVKFDHVHVTVLAHVLIVGDRKYCFNTYNGTMGKKAKPIDEQLDTVEGSFAVKDGEKERATLLKNGYELHDAGAPQSSDAANAPIASSPEADAEDVAIVIATDD